MANRYWVGGTAAWDGTIGLKWALTSGGVGGQLAPTSSDTVFFDANSGASTVTIGAGTAICSTLTCTGFTGIFAFGTNSITVAGTGNIYTGDTTYSVTGSPLLLCTDSSATLRNLAPAGVTPANTFSFNFSAGTGNVNTTAGAYKNLIFSGTFTGTLANNNRTMYGNLTLKTGMTLSTGANTTIFTGVTGVTTLLTTAGLTLDFPVTLNSSGTLQLQDALTMGATRQFLFISGTLDLNNKSLTCNNFSSNNSNTRSILFGTGNITVTGNNGSVWTTATATGFTYTGTPTVNFTYSGSVLTRNIYHGNGGGATETNSPNFNIQSGSDIVSINGAVKNLNFTGFTGTLLNTAYAVYGNLTFASGIIITAGANITTFAATSGTQTITSAGLNLDFPITINATGATVQLADALSIGTSTSRAVTLTSGTFDLNNNSVTLLGSFTGSGSATRTLAFGTGQFYLTSTTGNIWTVSGTNLTITGTSPTVSATANATTGERTIVHVPTTVSQALSINFNVTAGNANIGFGTGEQVFNNLNFTGFSGAIGNAGLSANARFTIYGNLTMGAGMTCIGGTSGHNFRGTGTQLITSNGVAFDQPMGLSGTGTYSLQDAFVTGATRAISFNTGTLQTNGYSVTCGTFSFFNSSTKTLDISNSIVTVLGGTSTTGFTGSTTGTTYNLTNAAIIFTTSGTALLNGLGSGATNTSLTITMGGTGQLIIGSASQGTVIGTLRNTVQPCTISLLSTANTLVLTNFNLSGTAGNLVTLNTTVAGTARTISKSSGTVNAQYMYIQDSTATGGAVWNARYSTDAGNNTGWNFSIIFADTVFEAFSILDLISVFAGFSSNITEPITLADTPNTTAAFISDTTEPITLADTQTGAATYAMAIVESISSITDASTAATIFATAITELLTVVDLPTATLAFTTAITENTTLLDPNTVLAAFNAAISEVTTIADIQTVTATFATVIAENTTFTDTPSTFATFAAAIVEAAILADSQTVSLAFNSAITESLTLDNSQTVVANFASVALEGIGVDNSQTVVASFSTVITENTTLVDVISATAAFVASLSEAITAADSSLAVRIHNSAVAENITPADTATAIKIYNALVTENITPADSITVIASFTSQITENLVLLDSPFPRGWYAINDGQTGNWAAVNNTESSTWTSINDGQTVTWVPVRNDYP